MTWREGDFALDGSISADDYFRLDGAFLSWPSVAVGAPLASAPPAPLDFDLPADLDDVLDVPARVLE